MVHLESWSVPDLRALCRSFQDRARAARDRREAELLQFAAQMFESEAARLTGPAGLGRHLSILV